MVRGRLSSVIFSVALLVVTSALLSTLYWAAATIFVRPLDIVEGEVLFEADRIRSNLALYTDPAVGAYDYGPVPARYLVLYPPVWPFFLSFLPKAWAAHAARLLVFALWYGLLGWIVLRAPRQHRRAAALAAMFVAGVWVLALFALVARPDALAVLCSGLALERVSRRLSTGVKVSLDAVSGGLFALAPWLKPNVVGAAPGAFFAVAFLAWLGARRASAVGAKSPLASAWGAVAPGIAGVALVSTCIAVTLTIVSGQAWITHLLASTGQPPSASLWFEQLGSRLPFFGLPLASAMFVGMRARKDPGAFVALLGLVSATAWCLLALAKIGSLSVYFLEPCVAGVIVFARAPIPASWREPRARFPLSVVALVQALWTGVGSMRSAFEHVPSDREQAAVIATARQTCGAPAGSIVLAEEPGVEFMMNGRIVQTPFQSTFLALRGKFPLHVWLSDVMHPEVACLVMQGDLLERPLSEVHIEHDRFGVELRRALVERFALVETRAGYYVYKVRPPED
ncbi:MAG: hypothetical protein FWD73_11045 [Polyangiaceae bacterium]|nr:hypothetical protein [Polyangiaceae bacterium]